MSSGAWLPADEILNAAKISMNIIVNDWKAERERKIQLLIEMNRKIRTREQAEKTKIIKKLTEKIKNPQKDGEFKSLMALAVLSGKAKTFVPDGQIFVSSDDFLIIKNNMR